MNYDTSTASTYQTVYNTAVVQTNKDAKLLSQDLKSAHFAFEYDKSKGPGWKTEQTSAFMTKQQSTENNDDIKERVKELRRTNIVTG